MTSISGHELAAYVGGTAQVIGYCLLIIGILRSTGYVYVGLNIFGAVLILGGIFQLFNPATAITQAFVFVISCYGLLRAYLLTAGIRFSEDEQRLLDSILPELPRVSAKKVVRAGTWITKSAGDVLTKEGEVLGQLIYLADGEAEVSHKGHPIGKLGPGSLVGEISLFTGGPVTATVTATSDLKLFTITADTLKQIKAKDHDLLVHIDAAITRELCDKLLAQNTRIAEERDQSLA
ncbi:MAG: cyclic nucleotide-binding domain-containing protein [Pseudomonadota bacterium]